MSGEKQRLIKLLGTMSLQHLQSLLDYAEFLLQKSSAESEPDEKLQPLDHCRPEDENVVNAIKRLRTRYFMLNTDILFNETSTLMGQFIIHGREAEAVIDDLETLFDEHFQNYLQS